MIYGHLVLCQAAATINLYIQQKMKEYPDDREELLMTLRNQKCTVYDTKIITAEPQSKANEFYSTFGIECPSSFQKKNGKLVPDTGKKKQGDQ